MPRNHSLNGEPTLIPIDNENTSELEAQETDPNFLPDNHPGEEEIQKNPIKNQPGPST